MQVLHGTFQHYAWGTTDAIPALLGRPADGRPVAEYWLGAHPLAPSEVGGERLDAVVAATPSVIGDASRAVFGDRFPYLVKVLSARHALSLQTHPSREQAEEGFAKENAAGIATDSPERQRAREPVVSPVGHKPCTDRIVPHVRAYRIHAPGGIRYRDVAAWLPSYHLTAIREALARCPFELNYREPCVRILVRRLNEHVNMVGHEAVRRYGANAPTRGTAQLHDTQIDRAGASEDRSPGLDGDRHKQLAGP